MTIVLNDDSIRDKPIRMMTSEEVADVARLVRILRALLHQQKTHFRLLTKVRFLNNVCQSSQSKLYGKMMTASPNDVRYA